MGQDLDSIVLDCTSSDRPFPYPKQRSHFLNSIKRDRP